MRQAAYCEPVPFLRGGRRGNFRTTTKAMNGDEILKEARACGSEMHLDLWYPRSDGSPIKSFVIGLVDVRAADDIRISYDFERDGWKIEQASTFEWDVDDTVSDPDWQEVAFIRAWAREKKSESSGIA